MKGSHEIINARMTGRSPAAVYIIDHPDTSPMEFGEVNVYQLPLDKMDFRFVVGLLVGITSTTEERCKQIAALCENCGARATTYGVKYKYYA
jgi:hypothetical protein